MTDDNSTDLPHLLVVDDSRLMRRAIVKILGAGNYKITEAADGEEGWKALLADETIQVVFSDLSMPVLDGYGLLDRIRNGDVDRVKKIAVIVITGAEDDEETKQKALSAGATDFISKPFDSVQLKTRTQAHVQAAATHRELNKATEDLVQKSEELEKSSTIDSLTGLANKNYFMTRGNKDIAFARRHRGELALLRVDIDNFNSLYTQHGKDPANFILKKISEVALESVRREDTVARIGVAKLAFILPQANRIGARQLAERMRAHVENTDFEYGGIILPVTLSIGLAALKIDNDSSLDDFISVADKHLALALANGGNSVVVDDMAAGAEQETEGSASKETVIADEIPDIEQALLRIEHGDEASLKAHLAFLLKHILPLLEVCNRNLKLDIDDAIKRIRQHLGE